MTASPGRSPFARLAGELREVFEGGLGRGLPDARFNDLALRTFAYQFDANPLYRRFAEGRGATPTRVGHWTEIPPVPTGAFKVLPLVSGDPAQVQKVFRTSGTTRGPGVRGEHHVLDLSLYRGSALTNFRDHLIPDGERLPLLSLIPSPEELPDSSLSYMVGLVARELAAPGGGCFVTPDDGIRHADLRAALERFARAGRPVLLVGTAFAFVHWMEPLDRDGWRIELPGGSRIMETGGFKGRSRTLTRDELHGGLRARLGVDPGHIVNEYGMTELLSQFYEPVLREALTAGGTARKPGAAPLEPGAGPSRPPPARHLGPPWVRSRVLHPVSLEPVAGGEEGLLCHFDLANLGSVAHVLTEDVGYSVNGGFRVVGRTPGAEPRGCSLAMDDLLAAARRGP